MMWPECTLEQIEVNGKEIEPLKPDHFFQYFGCERDERCGEDMPREEEFSNKKIIWGDYCKTQDYV